MTVSIDKTDDVWTIIHDQPQARNAVDAEHAGALADAFIAFEFSTAKAAVFWGKGGNFCAGWDLKMAATLSDPDLREPYFDKHAFPIGACAVAAGPDGSVAAGIVKAGHRRDRRRRCCRRHGTGPVVRHPGDG